MLDTVIRKYKSWANYHRTVNELSRLSSHELSDLGLSRSDIPSVARRSNG